MLDLVVVDGQARGIIVPQPGHRRARALRRRTRCCSHRRLRHGLLPVDQRGQLERDGDLARAQARRATSPTRASRRSTRRASRCRGDHQSKLTLMSESLRNDGRVWVPKKPGRQARRRSRFPRRSATTTSSGATRASATSCRATSRRAPPRRCATRAAASARRGLAVYLDFADAIKRLGADVIRARYGNLFDMYKKITDEDPYKVPMRIYPAVHYTMGGLWVDYNLMSNVPGPARARRGELLRPRREPPRRQRADAGAGRRLLRHPLHARRLPRRHGAADGHDRPRRVQGSRSRPCRTASTRLLPVKGDADRRANSTASSGALLWDHVGMARNDAGLQQRARARFRELREEFWQNVSVPGEPNNLNKNLEYAGRVADYLEFAELLALDALERARVVRRPLPRGEPDAGRRGAARRRRTSRYVAAWEFTGRRRSAPALHKEPLDVRGREAVAAELQVAASQPARPAGPSMRPTPLTQSTCRVWRQAGPDAPPGRLVDLHGASRRLARTCRSSRCSTSSTRSSSRRARTRSRSTPTAARASAAPAACVVNGVPHGPDRGTTVCQLHMRRFKDGDTITVEPWRAKAFPVIKDLVVDRSAFDRIIAGRRLHLGQRRAARRTPTPSRSRRTSPSRRWTPPRASAAAPAWRPARTPRPRSFTSAKISHLGAAAAGPGRARRARVVRMVEQMDAEGFGSCSNEGECEAVCPKEISIREHRAA